MKRNYKIVKRFLVEGEGWKLETQLLANTDYEEAAREASYQAHTLDNKYGDDHSWTVDLKNVDTNGSYFQLFHGRLS